MFIRSLQLKGCLVLNRRRISRVKIRISRIKGPNFMVLSGEIRIDSASRIALCSALRSRTIRKKFSKSKRAEDVSWNFSAFLADCKRTSPWASFPRSLLTNFIFS